MAQPEARKQCEGKKQSGCDQFRGEGVHFRAPWLNFFVYTIGF
jgi:hypothetical protein